MKKIIRSYLPDPDKLRAQRWFKPFANTLGHHELWHLTRHSSASGLAVGVACSLIPGPLQMLGAAILCVILRANLPLALVGTFLSNPFTIVPLYFAAYTLGSWVTGGGAGFVHPPARGKADFTDWLQVLFDWLIGLGHPLLIGLPILAMLLAGISYALVILAWNIHTRRAWQKRRDKRRSQ